jgi:transposase
MEEDYHVLKDVLLMPVMPIFHRLDDRIRVHAFLMVVGLLFYRWSQMRAQKALKHKTSIDRLAHLLKGVRVAAVKEVGGNKARFVPEKQDEQGKELVDGLRLARFVPK